MENIQTKKLRIGFYFVVAVWIGWMLTNSVDWSWEAKFFPLLVGVLGIVLVLVQLIRLIVFTTSEQDEVDSLISTIDDEPPEVEPKAELIMVAWVLGFLVLAAALGLFYALPIFLLMFLYVNTKNVKATLLITIIFSVLMYVFFVEVLGIRLWQGIFGIEPLL